jgi:mannosyl-oligosaccharide alpha-1,2-mannosidase
MLGRRRYQIFVCIAVLIILGVTQFREPIATTYSTARIKYGALFPSATNNKEGRFLWSSVPVNYPVKSLTSLPTGTPLALPRVQHKFPAESADQAKKRKSRQTAVKSAFQRCWKTYSDYAWTHDEVTPIHTQIRNSFGGWSASLVDSLDTLWIMGMKDEFAKAVDAAMDINLGSSSLDNINVFETTIRHLGGFLSAYDLSGDARLLEKATEFGEMLLKAFDTPNRMPITRWDPKKALTGTQVADDTVLLAEIGSLTMEFTHLSQLTGDMRWYDAVDRITRLFVSQQQKTKLPGMWPVTVDAKRADVTQDTFYTLNAMADSLYEYLPKMYALLGGLEPIYSEMYRDSMAVAVKHNLFKPMTPDSADILISGNVRTMGNSPPVLDAQGQHLGCFTGGMFGLGGKLFKKPDHVEIGKKLTNGCIWTYKALPMGIMPEVFEMVPCPSATASCPWDEDVWLKQVVATAHQEEGDSGNAKEDDAQQIIMRDRLPPGFTRIGDRRYILRPEAIESVFLMYRMTGDRSLMETAWTMFESIVAATQTPHAYAALADVTWSNDELLSMQASVKMDSMESFWMAETLKYFYLIFSEPNLINLDEWVFNTEAHPFKRPLPS